MKRLSVFIVAFLFAAGCGGGTEAPSSENSQSEGSQPEATVAEAPGDCSEAPLAAETPEGVEAPLSEIEPLTINASGGEEIEIGVETAENDADRAQGLMYRESLGEECGMVFVFDEEQTLSFLMRNTLVPLSIAYIDSEGSIVSIHDMEPLDETSVRSEGPAQYALEVNQGFFEERGVEVGDMVELPA
ncbi:MAG: DUF192 domain-containing protein [Rubrobacteraceae bacterium]